MAKCAAATLLLKRGVPFNGIVVKYRYLVINTTGNDPDRSKTNDESPEKGEFPREIHSANNPVINLKLSFEKAKNGRKANIHGIGTNAVEIKNKGADWGAKEINVVGKKEKQVNREADAEIPNINEFIMKYEYIPEGVFVMNLAVSDRNTFLITTTGRVFSWGSIDPVIGRKYKTKEEAVVPGEIEFEDKIICVVAGFDHAMALDVKGRVFSWGKNDSGQLGHRDKNIYYTPKQIEFFSNTNIKIAQIYAGANSSYAISASGMTYVWGDNESGQLGVSYSEVIEPIILSKMPWERVSDTKVVIGKNNRTYVYQFNNSADNKDQNVSKETLFKLQETRDELISLKRKNELLEQIKQNYEAKLYGKTNEKFSSMESMQNDSVLKELQAQIKEIDSKSNQLYQEVEIVTKEIDNMGRELETIQMQLVDILRKESELVNKREAHEIEMRKKKREINQNTSKKDLETLTRQQKHIQELTMANDHIKNTLLQKQSESEERKRERIERKSQLMVEIDSLKKKKHLYESLEVERKQTLSHIYVDEQRNSIDKKLDKIYNLFKGLRETTITEIAKQSSEYKGLNDLIADSNKQLKKIKKETDGIKATSALDSTADFVSKILEIFDENVSLRMKINEYILGILMQTSNRLEEFYQAQYEKVAKNHTEDNEEALRKMRRIQKNILKEKRGDFREEIEEAEENMGDPNAPLTGEVKKKKKKKKKSSENNGLPSEEVMEESKAQDEGWGAENLASIDLNVK